jgi:hypothetical protein
MPNTKDRTTNSPNTWREILETRPDIKPPTGLFIQLLEENARLRKTVERLRVERATA